jgi:2',3'-cyclic-nucleotide 2'-phosphodiesterase
VNYPPGTPGRGVNVYPTPSGGQVLVLCIMGTLMMEALDNPFAAAERELALAPLGERADAIIVEMHAEATSEKMAMGHFCDGRASLVVGTHTHVPTATIRSCPAAPPISPMPACAATMIRSSAWTRPSRSTAS